MGFCRRFLIISVPRGNIFFYVLIANNWAENSKCTILVCHRDKISREMTRKCQYFINSTNYCEASVLWLSPCQVLELHKEKKHIYSSQGLRDCWRDTWKNYYNIVCVIPVQPGECNAQGVHIMMRCVCTYMTYLVFICRKPILLNCRKV